MARFKLKTVTAAVPLADGDERRRLLQVGDNETLIERTLRGAGVRDIGRRLHELIVPTRLPPTLDYRADLDFMDLLDRQAPEIRWDEEYRGNQVNGRGVQAVLLVHRWAADAGSGDDRWAFDDEPDYDAPHQPVAVMVFRSRRWPRRRHRSFRTPEPAAR